MWQWAWRCALLAARARGPWDVTAITKTGGGRLHLAQGTTQNTFAGTININEGTLGADTPPNFGKPTTVTVANGATFDLSAIAGNTSAGSLANANLVIAGYGADDAGAFRRATGGTIRLRNAAAASSCSTARRSGTWETSW